MSLKKYVEKRHFDQTPEPAPRQPSPEHAPESQLRFCVQRHDASHLHYDLRLEVGGALKSWAVPKGPTLDPDQKRLAMMVEDHPMEYGNFEGVIPQGNYGGGSVMLWDRGTYELLGDAAAEAQLARGDFKFRLAGQKLAGEFAIVRMKRGKGNEWLLIKKRDAAAYPGWDPEDHAESVLTGRTQEEIARGLDAAAVPPPAHIGTSQAGAPPAGRPNSRASQRPERQAHMSPAGKRQAQVPEASLSQAPVSEADVRQAQLLKAGKRPAHLPEVGLIRALVSEADVRQAQLPKAGKRPAHLPEAGLSQGPVSEADMRQAQVPKAGKRHAHVPEAGLSQGPVSEAVRRPAQGPTTGTREAQMPKIIAPMLAELGKGEPPSEGDWLYEIKWDGVRAICFIDSGKLRMVSRTGNAIDKQYPELSILPHHVRAEQAIVDGEIAALDSKGRPSFELLQSRINVAEASAIARLAKNHPVVFFAFDLLYLDGRDLRSLPLIERKALLKEVLQPNDVIRYSDHFAASGQELLAAAREQGLEGIVGKRAQSRYESRRSSEWLKWKVVDSAEFVICGYTTGERDGLGALVLGTPAPAGKLAWAGNVGTGFDAKMVQTLFQKLKPLITKHSPLQATRGLPRHVTWTKPDLACEVRYANWTEEGRLRAPVFLGLRAAADLTPARPAPALLDSGVREAKLTIDGHALKLTNLDKLFYLKDGYRKRDLLNYYDAVAPLLLPHLKDRPLSLKRYPNGIDKPFFFQKRVTESFPDWLPTATADDIEYAIGGDRATLLYLVNLGCIDHNPWMSRVGSLEHPDYVLIDLDPYECSYEKIVEAGLWVRGCLDRMQLLSFPKTTGGDGMHIFVPLEPRYTYAHARSFAELLSTLGAAERPELFTTPRAVSRREKGKVYFDWQQIAQGKTISAPYVVRAYPGAPVATPLTWEEVTPRLRPEQFHLGNALERFERVGDLFQGVLHTRQRLETAIERMAKDV